MAISQKSQQNRSALRIASLLVTLSFLFQLVGCASLNGKQRTPEQYHPAKQPVRAVALVADLTPPRVEKIDLGITHGEGAAYGAVGGAVKGVAELGLVGVVLMPVFIVGGALIGPASGHSAETLAEAEKNAEQLLTSGYLQSQLLERVIDYGSQNTEQAFIRMPSADRLAFSAAANYRSLSQQAIDQVLEVKLLRIGLRHALEIDARVRLVSVQSGKVLHVADYRFSSKERDLPGWMADNAKALSGAIQQGLQLLAQDMVDEHFLLFYPQEPQPIATTPPSTADDEQDEETPRPAVPYYVLAPVAPKLVKCVFCGEGLFNTRPQASFMRYDFVEVASRQPLLRWQAFPRDFDQIGDNGQHRQISDVSYDLRLFNTTEGSYVTKGNFHMDMLVPGTKIYEVRGIPAPSHTVALRLEPGTKYFWSVRARFRLDGNVRLTEWSGTYTEPPWKFRIAEDGRWYGRNRTVQPEWYYFPFKTPKEPADGAGQDN